MAEFVFTRHARRASAEMQVLAMECRLLLAKSGAVAPALDRLFSAIDDYATAHNK
jgi:hypothetical protein